MEDVVGLRNLQIIRLRLLVHCANGWAAPVWSATRREDRQILRRICRSYVGSAPDFFVGEYFFEVRGATAGEPKTRFCVRNEVSLRRSVGRVCEHVLY
jgi:hypothetical protein